MIGWGGVFLATQNSKCQVLTKFSLGGGGGGGGWYSWQLKTQSPKSWPTFHFRVGGGGGVFLASQELALLAK